MFFEAISCRPLKAEQYSKPKTGESIQGEFEKGTVVVKPTDLGMSPRKQDEWRLVLVEVKLYSTVPGVKMAPAVDWVVEGGGGRFVLSNPLLPFSLSVLFVGPRGSRTVLFAAAEGGGVAVGEYVGLFLLGLFPLSPLSCIVESGLGSPKMRSRAA